MILTLDKVSKTAPNGKQILKNVGLGMYMVRSFLLDLHELQPNAFDILKLP